MGESAADRKARLKALRASRDGGGDGDAPKEPEAKKLRFRNYLPQSDKLVANFEQQTVVDLPPPDLGDAQKPSNDDDDDVDDDRPAAAKPKEQSAFEKELARVRAEETDETLSVVPKDPNWDLKRDIEPKLAVLRKRTQRAIVDILRARLKADAAA